MGSFTSAPKIMNGDVQDDDVDFSCVATQAEMKTRCQTELVSLPPLIQRQFRHVRIPSASPDIAAEPIRVLQWNILSQCKHILFLFPLRFPSRITIQHLKRCITVDLNPVGFVLFCSAGCSQ